MFRACSKTEPKMGGGIKEIRFKLMAVEAQYVCKSSLSYYIYMSRSFHAKCFEAGTGYTH